jgi:membrane-anchored glycerophosphoryl diester phosphodiesterase (GDPDase)
MYEDINIKGDKKKVLFEIYQKIKVCYIFLAISMFLSYRLGLGLPRMIREICTRNETIERRSGRW